MKKLKTRRNIIFAYNIALAIAILLIYLLIPKLLNYGPGTINTEFDKQMSGGLYYYQQIGLAWIALAIVITIVLFIALKDIDKYKEIKEKYEKSKKKEYEKKLKSIIKKCFTLPNYIFLTCTIIPILIELVLLLTQTYTSNSDFKLILIVFIISTLAVSIVNIYVKKQLSKVLIDLKNGVMPEKKGKLTTRILLQTVPILAVSILFTFLAISSVYEQNKGTLLSKYYTLQFKKEIDDKKYRNYEELINEIKTIELERSTDFIFITDENYNVIHSNGELTDFFKEYAKTFVNEENRIVYDYYGTYGQGVVYPIEINGSTYYIGSYYLIYSNEMFSTMLNLIIIIFVICILILIYFTYQLCKEIREVGNSLESIYKNKKINQQLYVTSNDEIGNLVVSMNQIQKMNQDYINQIQENQDTLMEQERMAALGQLIGGIAHNLKTPIMSISGATEGLTDLIKEYNESIEDKEVTIEDHHEIANDMSKWVDKIKDYTEYMSDIITAVKGQAVTLSEKQEETFTVDEVLKRVNILMKHELKSALVDMKVKVTDKVKKKKINGDVNSLVQILNNLIQNAIQSYGINNEIKGDKVIDFTIEERKKEIVFTIQDYGCGMNEETKSKLFKEMITTKGKNGTGLGLFMSYSTIKGRFNGRIDFKSEEGEGSTFIISIPEGK